MMNMKLLAVVKPPSIYQNPNYNVFKYDAYPSADFLELFGHENPTDTACVNSHTGFVIILVCFPVLWVSKLQTDIDLLTM